MSRLVVDVLGTGVGIAAPEPILSELRASLGDLATAASAHRELALVPGDQGLDLRDTGRIVLRGVDPVVIAATVVWHLNAIAAESRAHVVLHAAGIAGASGDGAVLLVGGSGAGKSTLTAACLGAGFAYLSDELAAIDLGTGLIAAYAKPLGLDGVRLVRASSLGKVAASATAPVALVFPRYEPGARTQIVRLDPGWAIVALAAHATNLAALGGIALMWLAGLARACPAFQLTYGDVTHALAVIEDATRGPGGPIEPALVLDPVTGDTTAVAVDDSLAVLHHPSGKVHLLNAAAATVWRRAAGAVGRHEPAAVDAVPAGPEDWGWDHSLASATVDQLVRSGLLTPPADA
jgi:hypothetical protein